MASSPTAGIEVHELTKHYGPVAAVRAASFTVAPGEIFGLLGVNGAGKTTIIECLLGLREPDTGSLTVAGIDVRINPRAARALVGAQLQFAALQDKITPRQALGLFASFYPQTADPEALLKRFNLTAKADATFDSLSGGQRQRLFLALAFVHEPPVLVLDEPAAGLDPQSRRELHALIAGLKASGRTVLLSTHDLEEAHQLCDRVGILHEGRIIAVDTPAGLIARSRALPRLTFRTARPLVPSTLRALPGVATCATQEEGWSLTTREVNRTIGALVQLLEAGANEMLDLQIHRPSLEDVFLELTGQDWPVSPEDDRP